MSHSKVKGRTEIVQLLSIILNASSSSAEIVMQLMAQICSNNISTLIKDSGPHPAGDSVTDVR